MHSILPQKQINYSDKLKLKRREQFVMPDRAQRQLRKIAIERRNLFQKFYFAFNLNIFGHQSGISDGKLVFFKSRN